MKRIKKKDLIDYTDKDNRASRFRQKVINYAKSRLLDDDFKWWLVGFMSSEEWAENEYAKYADVVRRGLSEKASLDDDAVATAGLHSFKKPILHTVIGGEKDPVGTDGRMQGNNVSPLEPWFYPGIHRPLGGGGDKPDDAGDDS